MLSFSVFYLLALTQSSLLFIFYRLIYSLIFKRIFFFFFFFFSSIVVCLILSVNLPLFPSVCIISSFILCCWFFCFAYPDTIVFTNIYHSFILFFVIFCATNSIAHVYTWPTLTCTHAQYHFIKRTWRHRHTKLHMKMNTTHFFLFHYFRHFFFFSDILDRRIAAIVEWIESWFKRSLMKDR